MQGEPDTAALFSGVFTLLMQRPQTLTLLWLCAAVLLLL